MSRQIIKNCTWWNMVLFRVEMIFFHEKYQNLSSEICREKYAISQNSNTLKCLFLQEKCILRLFLSRA